MTNLLKCPVCNHTLSRPHTLRCAHTVCLSHVVNSSSCPLDSCRPPPPATPSTQVPSSSRVAYFPAPPQPSSDPESHALPARSIDVTATRVLQNVRELTGFDSRDPTPDPPRPRKRRKYAQDVEEEEEDSARSGSDDESDLVTHLRRQSALQHVPPSLTPDLPSNSPQSSVKKELLSNLTCEICLLLLYQPITTPCQHTFCTKCLHRSLDHNPNCPICRQELPGFAYFQDAPTNSFLLGIIKTYFPESYEARGEAIRAEEKDSCLDTPIFVCQLSFPGMPTLLHFFEPRYRLMLRRCLESENPSFGMIMPPAPSGSTPPGLADAEYGTMLEIRSVQMLPDGRSMVETWGTHRFRILERGLLDGYTVGRVEMIDDLEDLDVPTAESSASSLTPSAVSTSGERAVEKEETSSDLEKEEPSLSSEKEGPSANQKRSSVEALPSPASSSVITPPSTEELIEVCMNFLSRLRAGTAPWVVQRLNNTFGPMPSPEEDLGGFTFWVGMVIPVDEREKAKLLPVRSARLRLRLCVYWIERLDGNWWVYFSIYGLLWKPFWYLDTFFNILGSNAATCWAAFFCGVFLAYLWFAYL